MSRDFVGALLQLNAEKQVSREQLIRTVEDAIAAAYRRVANEEDIHVQIDADSGRIRVFRARVAAVDPIEEEQQLTHFTLEEARQHKADAIPGELVEIEELDGDTFGRIGAQTAKQVVLQRLREAERDAVFDQFADKEGELVTGTVNRVEPRAMILDMGKGVEGVLATTEQSPLEHYRIGQNVKSYVLEVRRTPRGPTLFVSRTHKGFLKRLFELEVPEIHNGTVEIRAIAREAGSRSKVAVASRQEGLDPVGATVGQRGARVQSVVAELGGEKIDVIPWNDDPTTFVANALSPAQVLSVDIDHGAAAARERDRAGADALARDRARGPERAPRRPPDRLAHRHPERRVRRRGEGRREPRARAGAGRRSGRARQGNDGRRRRPGARGRGGGGRRSPRRGRRRSHAPRAPRPRSPSRSRSRRRWRPRPPRRSPGATRKAKSAADEVAS